MQRNLSLTYENIKCVIECIDYSPERLGQECPTRSPPGGVMRPNL
jgi:hypothetical protein